MTPLGHLPHDGESGRRGDPAVDGEAHHERARMRADKAIGSIKEEVNPSSASVQKKSPL